MTLGRTPTRYDPGRQRDPRTDGLPARGGARGRDRPIPTAEHDWFTDDDGSVHEANVNALAGLQVYFGDALGRAAVNRTATRAQMASLVTRDADVLLQEDRLSPPAS